MTAEPLVGLGDSAAEPRVEPARACPPATILVLAKAPRAGRVKTRLHARYLPEQAAALARAALADTLDAAARTAAARRVLVLDGEPAPWLQAVAQQRGGFDLRRQAAGGLDRRIAAALDEAFADGDGGPVLLVGMDTPQIHPGLLEVDWTGVDAVLGLSEDGGYWAIGLRTAQPDAVRGVPMSRPDTGRRQLERLRSLGLRVRLLPLLRDVDTPDDADAVARSAPWTRFARLHARLTPSAAAGPVTAAQLYDEALTGARVAVASWGGRRLDVARWLGPPDDVDELMLGRCEPPVLDVGCGPGRMVGSLAAQGIAALGIDVSPRAVTQTAERGASVLRRPVEGRLPGEGRWGTVLLADGNIGIGGDPLRLLQRCAALVRPGGLVLVEADGEELADDREAVVLVAADGRRAEPLPWARVGARALARLAAAAGLLVIEEWRAGDRVFLALDRPL